MKFEFDPNFTNFNWSLTPIPAGPSPVSTVLALLPLRWLAAVSGLAAPAA
jgi:hypothetical protein